MKSKPIRIIASFLAAAFLLQDIAWAYPDKLQIELRTSRPDFRPAFETKYLIDEAKRIAELIDTSGPMSLERVFNWRSSSEWDSKKVRFVDVKKRNRLSEVRIEIGENSDVVLRYFGRRNRDKNIPVGFVSGSWYGLDKDRGGISRQLLLSGSLHKRLISGIKALPSAEPAPAKELEKKPPAGIMKEVKKELESSETAIRERMTKYPRKIPKDGIIRFGKIHGYARTIRIEGTPSDTVYAVYDNEILLRNPAGRELKILVSPHPMKDKDRIIGYSVLLQKFLGYDAGRGEHMYEYERLLCHGVDSDGALTLNLKQLAESDFSKAADDFYRSAGRSSASGENLANAAIFPKIDELVKSGNLPKAVNLCESALESPDITPQERFDLYLSHAQLSKRRIFEKTVEGRLTEALGLSLFAERDYRLAKMVLEEHSLYENSQELHMAMALHNIDSGVTWLPESGYEELVERFKVAKGHIEAIRPNMFISTAIGDVIPEAVRKRFAGSGAFDAIITLEIAASLAGSEGWGAYNLFLNYGSFLTNVTDKRDPDLLREMLPVIIDKFTLAKAIMPNEPHADYMMGIVYRDTGKILKAKEHFLSALRIRPAFLPAWTGFAALSGYSLENGVGRASSSGTDEPVGIEQAGKTADEFRRKFITGEDEPALISLADIVKALSTSPGSRIIGNGNGSVRVRIISEAAPYILPLVRADRDKIQRVFDNLIKNAAEAGANAVTLKTYQDDRYVCVDVWDNGSGILTEVLPHVFDKDYTNGKPNGNGLGLAGVKDIVTEYGGAVNIESRHISAYPDGHGTKVTVRLPAAHLSAAGKGMLASSATAQVRASASSTEKPLFNGGKTKVIQVPAMDDYYDIFNPGIARYMDALRNWLGSQNSMKVGVYPGSGVDISYFLRATDARCGLFMDRNGFDPADIKPVNEHWYIRYMREKYENGYPQSTTVEEPNNLYPVLLVELNRMGVKSFNLTEIAEKVFRIEFKAGPDPETPETMRKDRVIYLIPEYEVGASDIDSDGRLKAILADMRQRLGIREAVRPADFYFEKANGGSYSWILSEAAHKFMRTLVREDGLIVTDSYPYHDLKNNKELTDYLRKKGYDFVKMPDSLEQRSESLMQYYGVPGRYVLRYSGQESIKDRDSAIPERDTPLSASRASASGKADDGLAPKGSSPNTVRASAVGDRPEIEAGTRETLARIRQLLSAAENDKKVARKDVKPTIIADLLSIQRGGVLLFKQRHAEKIARLRKLSERLSLLEYLILYQIEQHSRKKFLFNGAHIALILASSRSAAEIAKLIELKKTILREKGDSYPEHFIRYMLLRFAFMDDPMPLLKKIMDIDFDTVKLEIEQLPANMTRWEFEQRYGDMAIWILRFFGVDFRSLRAVVRGYAKELFLSDLIPGAEEILPSPDNTEGAVGNILLRESLEMAIRQLSGEEQDVVQMFYDGDSEEEISSTYPGISLPEIFAKLREIISSDPDLLGTITPSYAASSAEARGSASGKADDGLAPKGPSPSTPDPSLSIFNKSIPFYLYVLQDLFKEALGYILTLMKRNNGSSSIGMFKIDMASTLSDWFKTKLLKYFDYYGRLKRDKPHLVISTSWRPMNLSRGTSFSTSRHNNIASLIRLSRAGTVFAWVWQPLNAAAVAIYMPFSSRSIRTGNTYLDILSSFIQIKDTTNLTESQPSLSTRASASGTDDGLAPQEPSPKTAKTSPEPTETTSTFDEFKFITDSIIGYFGGEVKLRRKKILELGPGSDIQYIKYFRSLGADAAGIDKEVSSSAEYVIQAEILPYLMTLPDNSLDAVLASDVLTSVYEWDDNGVSSRESKEKLPRREYDGLHLDALEKIYQQLKRVVKRGGIIVEVTSFGCVPYQVSQRRLEELGYHLLLEKKVEPQASGHGVLARIIRIIRLDKKDISIHSLADKLLLKFKTSLEKYVLSKGAIQESNAPKPGAIPEGGTLSSDTRASASGDGVALEGPSSISQVWTNKPYRQLVELIKERVSTLPSDRFGAVDVELAMNERREELFSELAKCKKDIYLTERLPEDSQAGMCYLGAYAFYHAFIETFQGHKVSLMVDPYAFGRGHYWAQIDDEIVVDITYGQFNPDYKERVLVTTQDKLSEFGFMPGHSKEVDMSETNTLFQAGDAVTRASASGDGIPETQTPQERRAAIRILGEKGDFSAIPALIRCLGDEYWYVRSEAADALVRMGQAAVQPLINCLKSENPFVRRAAVGALGRIGDQRAAWPIIDCLGDRDSLVRYFAAKSLGSIGAYTAVEPLILRCQDGSEDQLVRLAATQSLGRFIDPRAIQCLVACLKDANPDIAFTARDALVNIGQPAVEALKECLEDKSSEAYYHAVRVLEEIEKTRASVPRPPESRERPRDGIHGQTRDSASGLSISAATKLTRDQLNPESIKTLADYLVHSEGGYPLTAKMAFEKFLLHRDADPADDVDRLIKSELFRIIGDISVPIEQYPDHQKERGQLMAVFLLGDKHFDNFKKRGISLLTENEAQLLYYAVCNLLSYSVLGQYDYAGTADNNHSHLRTIRAKLERDFKVTVSFRGKKADKAEQGESGFARGVIFMAAFRQAMGINPDKKDELRFVPETGEIEHIPSGWRARYEPATGWQGELVDKLDSLGLRAPLPGDALPAASPGEPDPALRTKIAKVEGSINFYNYGPTGSVSETIHLRLVMDHKSKVAGFIARNIEDMEMKGEARREECVLDCTDAETKLKFQLHFGIRFDVRDGSINFSISAPEKDMGAIFSSPNLEGSRKLKVLCSGAASVAANIPPVGRASASGNETPSTYAVNQVEKRLIALPGNEHFIAVHNTFTSGESANLKKQGFKVYLSKSLFREEDIGPLSSHFNDSEIELLDPESIMHIATNKNTRAGSIGCIVSKEDLKTYWNGSSHKNSTKAVMLAVDVDTSLDSHDKDYAYVFVEGLVGLIYEMAAKEKDIGRIRRYISLLFDEKSVDAAAKALEEYLKDNDSMKFALHAILKLKALEPLDTTRFDDYKRNMDTLMVWV